MWRRAGQHAVPVALVAALVLASPASAQLRSTPDSLPGSDFQGADGDQDDAAPLIDWQALQAAARVQHNPDENDEDTAFAGGSKELQPGKWELTTERGGVNPAKANIRDAWSAVDQPGGDTFVYLGFTREASTGTTFLTFELNHDARLWDNGQARIPCRRTGDMLVSYEQLGNTVRAVIRRWTTTESDTSTGCATTGRLNTFRELKANNDVQAAMNADAITSRLPGAITGTVPAGRFGEAALNLTQLLEQAFGERCMAFNSIWMHSRSSDEELSQMQDYVAPRALDVWTCTASGTKFFDLNANGRRDPNDPGIPRFQIWADYNDNGIRENTEPFSVSDLSGRYVIHDIRPPDGTYMLREKLLGRRSRALPVASDWQCSYPNAGTPGGTASAPNGRFRCGWLPINVNTNPNVGGRDFGNWFPARLTVEKRLFPSADPGRYDLLVDEDVFVPMAGDRAIRTESVAPGTYTISERAVTGTDPAAYRTAVWCRGARLRGSLRSGATSAQVRLSAGQAVKCTFYNVRRGTPPTPAIAIAKYGPEVAVAGDTLQYELVVTNPGEVPFPQADVRVTDPQCDDPPQRTSTGGDTTPGTLDPGDQWTYRCSNSTPRAGDDCDPTTVPNMATVTGTTPGGTVEDEASISTILQCPDNPVPPIPPTPPGPGPRPVVPPGPTPPNADDAGTAGLIVQQSIQGCIGRRVPRLNLEGARISRVRIFVDGRFIRGLTLRTLQAAARPRVTLAPGKRYRIRVRVTFQPGTDSPPVTFTGTFRTCARPRACPSATAAGERGARIACASSAAVRRWRRPT